MKRILFLISFLFVFDSTAQIQVLFQDDGISSPEYFKPRVFIKKNNDDVKSSLDLSQPIFVSYFFSVENEKTPVLENWYSPNCDISLENIQKEHFRVILECDLSSFTWGETVGELFPNEGGIAFGLHYDDWSTWSTENDYSWIESSSPIVNSKITLSNSRAYDTPALGLPQTDFSSDSAGPYSVKVYTKDAGNGEENFIKPNIRIENTGDLALKNLVVEYVIELSQDKKPILEDWSGNSITAELHHLKENVWIIRWYINELAIEPGGQLQLAVGLHYSDWSPIDAKKTYSTPKDPWLRWVSNQNIRVFTDGVMVFGYDFSIYDYQFIDVTDAINLNGVYGKRIGVTDINGDGVDDLHVAVSSATEETIQLLLWDGTKFTDITHQSGILKSRVWVDRNRVISNVSFADIDNDGDQDAFTWVSRQTSGEAVDDNILDRDELMLNNGDGTFSFIDHCINAYHYFCSSIDYSDIKIANGPAKPTIGEINDLYIDMLTGEIYGPKTASGWENGPLSIDADFHQYPNVPSHELGKIGDIYLDTRYGYLYGPKTEDGWGEIISQLRPDEFLNTTGVNFVDLNLDGKLEMLLSSLYPEEGAPIIGTRIIQLNGIKNIPKEGGWGKRDALPVVSLGNTVVDVNGDPFPDIIENAYGFHPEEGKVSKLWENYGSFNFEWDSENNLSRDIGIPWNLVTYNIASNYDWENPGSYPNYRVTTSSGTYPRDFDNDGDMDLFQAVLHGTNGDETPYHSAILTNDGVGNFTWDYSLLPERTSSVDNYLSHHNDLGVAWIDIDNDGLVDLIVSESYMYRHVEESYDWITNVHVIEQHLWNNRIYVYKQKQDHTFEDISELIGLNVLNNGMGWPIHHILPWDYDMDGRLDLLLASPSNYLRIFKNNIETDNNWIQIRLEGDGVLTNRDALHARITVSADGITQTQEVMSGSGNFTIKQSLTKHFGLGDANYVEVSVKWPNGLKQPPLTFKLSENDLNRCYVVRESDSSVKPCP
jgi:hypothetical protein